MALTFFLFFSMFPVIAAQNLETIAGAKLRSSRDEGKLESSKLGDRCHLDLCSKLVELHSFPRIGSAEFVLPVSKSA